MQQYPAFLNLKNRKCLVIGHQHTALRQARTLANSGAQLIVLYGDQADNASTAQAWSQAQAEFALHTLLPRAWRDSDLQNCWLVVVDTGNQAVNREIAAACEQRRILCSVADDPAHSTFTLPAVVDRSPLLVAIGSGAESPILSRLLKAKIESLIPTSYAHFANVVSRHRAAVKARLPNRRERGRFWQQLLNSAAGELALSRGPDYLQQITQRAIEALQTQTTQFQNGQVALVGAGPGDPDLLTLRAMRLIQSADVIVYDRLVSAEILKFARTDAELIYAGKARSDHAIPQHDINQLLVDLATKGKHTVRLKGGDPFIFGRGGEEIETLADAGIPFQVVPGITAAAGCAAFAGIPLTHRDHAQSCVFVTGHLQNGEVNMNWHDLQDASQTIVVYMGLLGLAKICQSLIASGRNANTAAALVEQGTTPEQRVLVGTLLTLPSIVETSNARAPTLLIIGNVVTLRNKLQWFDHPNSDPSGHHA